MPPSRRLSAAERALWARVAAGVRRTEPAVVEPEDFTLAATSPSPSPRLPPAKAVAAQRSPVQKPSVRSRPPPVRNGNTLDGAWDRKLATGTVAPDMTIDLHGCSLDQAHDRLDHGIARAIAHDARIVLLVTGKPPRDGTSRLDLPLRGIIRASVHDWIAAAPFAHRIAAVRPAHPRHGGAGALYVIIRRARI